ncbi:MAG: tRNA lysidine(34) synthetase TilS [Candidatus Poribacteria bacterium]
MSQETPIARQFTDAIEREWRRHDLAPWGSTVLVAVSGGADSMALLDALVGLRDALPIKLAVGHLNHRLRGEDSDSDEEFVTRQAEERGLRIEVARLDVGALAAERRVSVETAGREARQEFLTSAAERIGAARIALGHQRDDVAETVLMRLLRGTGSRGLAAMAPIRDELWIRPLLSCTREEVTAYLDAQGVPHVEDRSNSSRDHLRNRVRRDLLPLLEREYNPRAKRALAAMSTVLRDEDALLHDMTTKAARRVIGTRGADAAELTGLPLAVCRRVIRRWLEETVMPRPLTFEETERVREYVARETPTPLWVTRQVRLDQRDGRVEARVAASGPDLRASTVPVALDAPGRADLPSAGVSVRAKFHRQRGFTRGPLVERTAAYDADVLPGPLTLRGWRPGDRFQPFGMTGTKTVADYLSDARVPSDERGRVAVLCSGDEVIWVVGRRADGRYPVTGGTRRVLIVEAEEVRR